MVMVPRGDKENIAPSYLIDEVSRTKSFLVGENVRPVNIIPYLSAQAEDSSFERGQSRSGESHSPKRGGGKAWNTVVPRRRTLVLSEASLAQARATRLSEVEGRPGTLLWSSPGEGRHCWARGCRAQASQDSPKRACEEIPAFVAISPKREYP
ncbi:hypothetical protein DEO72_LG8g944 [Vigna unguiculata]|uniref:Uncharacterized protein n=1 Tax=Vigna unguiculata TaxID=3917 RepID=A0A4D6MPH3_VIGUN|nr:hypothetical protein DEO72_LG8g944 [Vigna unguiculata]